MSFIGQAFGGGKIQQFVNKGQTKQAYTDTQTALAQQRALVGQLQAGGAQGMAGQSSVFNQQQGLADQLGLQAQGQGPNPALAQLAQATGANTANQAAMMAGAKGSGQNAGLMARQAANVGAANQQGMAGQAATMQAQQQIAAQQALMQQQQSMGQLAGQQVNQLQGAVQNQGSMALNQQSNLLGAGAAQNQSNIGAIQAGGQLLAGLGGAAAGGAKMMAHGGQVGAPNKTTVIKSPGGHGSIIIVGDDQKSQYAEGGCVSNVGRMLKGGGLVPGQPKVQHDSYQNDVVDAKLSAGEVVIPLHIMNSKNPAEEAKKFVAAILAKQSKRTK